jgi:enoyl-CoA hydratase/carnithine racemase
MAQARKWAEIEVGTSTLDNPKKHNTLSASLIADLIEALNDLIGSRARVIVLRALSFQGR